MFVMNEQHQFVNMEVPLPACNYKPCRHTICVLAVDTAVGKLAALLLPLDQYGCHDTRSVSISKMAALTYNVPSFCFPGGQRLGVILSSKDNVETVVFGVCEANLPEWSVSSPK